LNKSARWQAYDINYGTNSTTFKVKTGNKYFGKFKIKLLGEHSVLNALACITIAYNQGISKQNIVKALFNFSGCQRRFNISKKNGIVFIDDYAHHPTEIKTTINAVKQKFSNKYIRCVFQPHMVSRTKALVNDFAQCFFECDQVAITDIFASAREKSRGINSKDLVNKIKKNHPNVKYTGSLKMTDKFIKQNAKKGEVVVIMGAGDVYKLI